MDIRLLQNSVEAVRRGLDGIIPDCSLVLGSGWGQWVEAWAPVTIIPYADIPVLGHATVPGHGGRISLVERSGLRILVFHGRRHWYEGCGWEPVVFPSFLSASMRCSALVLTCAAGGIQTDMRPGDIVIIRDHINMMGANPLVGPHDPILGPRFPDMSKAYDESLRRQLADAASEAGVQTRSGIYAALSGPAYETPAEISALRNAGADLVGMSTVPETLVARAMGLRVLAIACVTNLAAGMAPRPLDHAEVLATTQASSTRIQALLEHFLTKAQTQLRIPSD